ncbi:MAG: DMT family transporter [Candidatus Roizmanbacteria bacterium]
MYHLYILVAAVLWGFDGLLRSKLYTVQPFVIVFGEHILGLILLSLIILIKRRPIDLKGFTKKMMFSALFISLFSGLVGTLAFTSALARVNYIPFSIVFLIQKIQPLFTISAAYIFLKEKPSKGFLIWALLAICAGVFMTFPGGQVKIDTQSPYTIAAGLALIAAASWGVSTIFSRYLLQRKSMFTVTFIRFVLTSIIAGIVVLATGTQNTLLTLSSDQYISLGLIASSTGMVALLIYYKGLQHVPAHVSCIIELAFPITGLVIDAVHGAYLMPSQYLAALIMVMAMYRIVKNQRPRTNEHTVVTKTHTTHS